MYTREIIVACIACLVLGFCVGALYFNEVDVHNEKVEFFAACQSLDAGLDRNQCTIMWYSRGAAH